MSKCYVNPNFFEFVIAKHIPFESLEEDFSNFAGEDSFNSDTAEAALELAFDLYPEKPGEDEDDTMDKRHEFVDEFIEYARCEVIKKWAGNLGMYTKEEAQANVDTQREVCKTYWTDKFKRMSAYQFSAWKLGVPANDKDNEKIMESVEDDIFYNVKYGEDDTLPSEYQPQDSEDECWEQMIAQQRANNNHSQDI